MEFQDGPVIMAASNEFLKLCHNHGLTEEQMLQTAIAVGSSIIADVAGPSQHIARDLIGRFLEHLRYCVKVVQEQEFRKADS